jgi:hypothetical protein
MKPFDLQAAINGAPIQFNNGEKLKFVAYVPEATFDDRFVFLDAVGNIRSWPDDNTMIFMTPVCKTYWFSVCAGKSGVPYFGSPFESEADATQFSNYLDGYIKTISIEVEE